MSGPDPIRQREIVEAFLAAARGGDVDKLLELLDPDVVLRSDPAAVATGADRELVGAAAVAGTFSGRARAAHLALVDGAPGLVWAQGGKPRVVFSFTIGAGTIVGIEVVADPERLSRLDVAYLDG